MRVLIYGAGLVGGYLGGQLHSAGLNVTLLTRPQNAECWSQDLELTDYLGNRARTSNVPCLTDLEQLVDHPDVVMLTVKCSGLEKACLDLESHLKKPTIVICFQNGVGAREMVQARLEGTKVYYGMVAFNVTRPRPNRLHRGTQGDVEVENFPELTPLLEGFKRAGVPARVCTDPQSAAWGKLLLNLNNAVNALAGVPLLEELRNRSYRRVLAACQDELLVALRAAGIRPARLTKAPASLLPRILRLPNWLFQLVARQMLAIDPLARSSMWDDLMAHKVTEVDFLNGAVVNLAKKHGVPTPVNEAIIDLIKKAELEGNGSPALGPEELLRLCS